MNLLKKGLLVGVVNLVIGMAFNWLAGAVLPVINQEYQSSGLFRPWDDPLMLVFFAYPFMAGLALAYVWEKLHTQLTGKTIVSKAAEFAKFYFLVATIPGMFISYTSFKISLLMVLLWTLSGYLQAFVAGWIFARTND